MSESERGDGATPSFQITFSEPGEAELDAAYTWLLRFGFEVAQKWLTGLTQSLDAEADLLASVPMRRPIAPESPDNREYYVLLYRSGGRRGSPWHIVYELVDDDADGTVDALRVVRIRYAARGDR